jgi:isochorismate pyruvate lyase
MSEILPPDDCQTMAQVRAGVNATDAALVSLLAERFGYMRAAARIKPDRSHVRDDARKAQVIAQVREQAAQLDLPSEAIAELWDRLVEVSIAYEMDAFDRRS